MPPPDADLRPVAIGLPEETVDRHCSKEPLILYAGWFLSVRLLNPPRPPRLIDRATRSGTTSVRVIPSFQRFLQHPSGRSQPFIDEVCSDYHGRLLQFADAMDKDDPN
jgi:hypothetical protein